MTSLCLYTLFEIIFHFTSGNKKRKGKKRGKKEFVVTLDLTSQKVNHLTFRFQGHKNVNTNLTTVRGIVYICVYSIGNEQYTLKL